MRKIALSLCLVLVCGCTPSPQPKPWTPSPLPPAPLPKEEAIDPMGQEELENVVQGKITQYTPNERLPPPKEGNFGWRPNPKEQKEFLDSLSAPTLFQANPELKESRTPPKINKASFQEPSKKPTLLYRALLKKNPGWQVGSQGIGDCVSWGWAHGCDVSLAVDNLLGVAGEWKHAATEAIYGGSRVEARGRTSGGWSDGSYGAAAAKWVNKAGGVVFRENFPDFGYDLSTYSSSRAKDWGNYGCGGKDDNGRLDKHASKYPASQVAQVRSFKEAAAAIESGYPVPVCSGQGFSSKRDAEGFSAPSGSWAHCMCFTGVRYNPNGLLCQNSWGTKWISGPKYPEDQPEGSFWVRESTCDRMLGSGDSFAVSHIKGFPKRQLRHDLGW